MITAPNFESVAIVSDEPRLAAEIASLFARRSGRYLAVIDGPRMSRSDASNEVIRRKNALGSIRPRRILLAGLPSLSADEMANGWDADIVKRVHEIDEAVEALKGLVKRPKTKMQWGNDNLGVGLLLARREKAELVTTPKPSPTTSFVSGGRHLLITCEAGEALAEIACSCLAFATNAALLILPKQPKEESDSWLEELYDLESGGDVSVRFETICNRARQTLGDFPFDQYKQVLFVTSGFPWGIALPECITTHMYNYPDFGRCTAEGIWASQDPKRTGRNALLVDPQKVVSSEISEIAEALMKNGTLVRVLAGPNATVRTARTIIETLPFDIIVISTHAGDAPGQRSTYEYFDSDGNKRQLVVDEAVGFSYDPTTDQFEVQQYSRFHELDGVNWNDPIAKSALHIGSAIVSWSELGNLEERNKYKISSETIRRVAGSMALRMHDHLWIPIFHGLAPGAAPLIFNNACSSWHEISRRFMFAGARGYIGTLFPVTDIEAQEIGRSIFKTHLRSSTPEALWKSQNMVYGNHGRRPYAMVGLPWCAIRQNHTNSVSYMAIQYEKAITEYSAKANSSEHWDIRENSSRYRNFLEEDFQSFTKNMTKIHRRL